MYFTAALFVHPTIYKAFFTKLSKNTLFFKTQFYYTTEAAPAVTFPYIKTPAIPTTITPATAPRVPPTIAAVFVSPLALGGAVAFAAQEVPSPPQTPHLSTLALPNGIPLQSNAQVVFFPPQSPHRS